jgi:anti-sigma factor RsiW
MMPHKPYGDWMQAALDGSLDPGQRAQLDEHLAACRECASRWAALGEVEKMFGSAPLAAPRAGFTSRFKARLAQRHSRPKTMWGALALGLGAVGAAALVVPAGAGLLLSGFRIAQEPATTIALYNGVNATASFASILGEALLIAGRAVFEWAVVNPLVWAASVTGLGVTGVWFYFMRKLIPEGSFR